MKVIINRCFGGFGLSHEAVLEYAKRKGIQLYFEKSLCDSYNYYTVPVEEYKKIKDVRQGNEKYFSMYNLSRTDPILVQVVEDMGEGANGSCSSLSVVEIPDGISYEIDDYDGQESIHETHRSWS